jgi:site-specific DNA recombinase
MSVAEQEEMIAALKANSRHTHDQKRGAASLLYRRPRTYSIFPAQHATCGICQGTMHRELRDQIQCSHSDRTHREPCWNRVMVQCEPAREKIFAWLQNKLERFPNHREAFLDEVWSAHEQEVSRRLQKLEEICEQVRSLEKEAENLAAAIAAGGEMTALVKQSKATDSKIKKARKEEEQETACLRQELTVISREELATRPLEGTLAVARRSAPFAVFLRRLFPRLEIIPVQSLDRGRIGPRARIALRLAELRQGIDAPDEIQAEIDLFDPPEHIKHLKACLAEKVADPNLTLKQIATKLNIGHMTVKRALDYAERMKRLGAVDPYVVLTERPEYSSRWKERSKKASRKEQNPPGGTQPAN